jgi:organic radical activating enzyme
MISSSFCPAPWLSLFYQSNRASLCCTSRDKILVSPNDYIKSNYLREIKQQFLDGIRPSTCNSCWQKEDKGLHSIRKYYTTKYAKLCENFDLTSTDHLGTKWMELRISNQCNFSCRMCNTESSSMLQKEVEANPELTKFFSISSDSDYETSTSNWNQILEQLKDTDRLFLTGGEPMLIKKYYDVLDYLISIGKQDIELFIFTNCSVYNPLFIGRLKQFKNLHLNLSIDAVGKTAEYVRYGTDWPVVEKNTLLFCKEFKNVAIHSTITSYGLLDYTATSKFFQSLSDMFPSLQFKAHVATTPIPLKFENLPAEMKTQARVEINNAIQILQGANLSKITMELANILKKLDTIGQPEKFLEFTNMLDKVRGQSLTNLQYKKPNLN